MILHKFYLQFLFKTGLTQSQFLLLHLIYNKDQKYIDMYKERFPTDDGTMIGKVPTQQLLNEGWLTVNKDRILQVTDKFKEYYVIDEIALEELIQIYPPFYDKGGVKIPLVTVSKHEYSLKYGRKIYNSYQEHKEVMKDLQFAVNNNLINFGIAKFIDSDMWIKLRPMRLGQENIQGFEEDLSNEDF
jgi:hypothetical protein